jgi:hypothetical protein
MKIYSASEAIWPALLRTYSYLFRPFKLERFLKLATVATLCEGFVISFKFTVSGTFPFEVDAAKLQAFLFAPDFLPVTVLGAIALVLMGIYALYLVTQLRFAFFHSLIHQTHAMKKSARIYFIETERFFTASALVWLAFLVLGVLAILLFIVAGYTVLSVRTPEGKLDPGNFLILFFPCIAVTFSLILAAFAAQVVLNDFILPHMAIEGATFSRAWDAVRGRILANRESFVSYFILRLALPLLGCVVLAFAAWIAGLLVFGLLGMSAAGFEAMLDGAGGLRATLLMALNTLFVLLGIGAGWAILVSFGGPLGVFVRSYALYFYGGHYRPLGNLVEPLAPPLDPAQRRKASPYP